MVDVLAGARIRASYWTPLKQAFDDTVISAGAAGNYFSGTPSVSTTFIAPESQRVLIGVSCFADKGAITAAGTLIATYRLHEGTSAAGTEIQGETLFARSARYTVFTTTPAATGGSMGWSQATGLAAGQEYYAEWRGQQLVGAGGSTQLRGRKLIVLAVT